MKKVLRKHINENNQPQVEEVDYRSNGVILMGNLNNGKPIKLVLDLNRLHPDRCFMNDETELHMHMSKGEGLTHEMLKRGESPSFYVPANFDTKSNEDLNFPVIYTSVTLVYKVSSSKINGKKIAYDVK